MKEFLAGWIIIQLIVIGIAGGNILYEKENNLYVCESMEDNKKYSKFSIVSISALFPLIFFVSTESGGYCKNK